MGPLARGLVLAALFGALLTPITGTSRAAAAPTTDDVAQVVGRGLLDRALCLGCAAAIVGVGGLTWGGIVMLASLNPDVIGACAYQCYRAFAQ